MKPALCLLSLLAVLGLSNCASTTPSGRIEKNLKTYNDLSTREQELVSQGQIEAGMSPGAVFLALGEPDRRLEGESDGMRTMRWDYSSLYPVYTNRFFGGYGYRSGYYGRRYGGFGFSPTVEYIPTRSSTVWFEQDKVKSWERIRR